MIGKVFFMELRTSWKGILIFAFIVFLLAYGMAAMFPTYRDALMEDLQGSQNLEIELPDQIGGNISLSWTPVENVSSYYIVESKQPYMDEPTRIFNSTGTNITISYDFDEKRYYTVSAITNASIFPEFIGMISTKADDASAFDEFLENPAYSGMTGDGKVTSITEIKGFLSLEFFSWWILLGGLFLAYMSVSTVADDFEGKRMDLIFSTPITREHYLVEKFAALTAITIFILLVAVGSMSAGISAVDMSSDLDSQTVLLAVMGSLPMLLVIQAIGVLSTVQFRSTRAGMGIAFLFVLVEFVLYTAASMSASIEYVKYLSVMHYWDYNTVLYDGVFKIGDFIGLFIVTGLILLLAIVVFKKKDIPA